MIDSKRGQSPAFLLSGMGDKCISCNFVCSLFHQTFENMNPCQLWLAPQGWQAEAAHLRRCSVFTLFLPSSWAACWNSVLTPKSAIKRLLPALVLKRVLLRPGMQKQSENATFSSIGAWYMNLCAIVMTHSDHGESREDHSNLGILASGATWLHSSS